MSGAVETVMQALAWLRGELLISALIAGLLVGPGAVLCWFGYHVTAVRLAPGATRTVTLDLLTFDSLGPLSVEVASQDSSVAAVSPALQTIPAGERDVTLTITAGGGPSETLVYLRHGVDVETLRVVVGVASDRAPATTAAPIGVEVLEGP